MLDLNEFRKVMPNFRNCSTLFEVDFSKSVTNPESAEILKYSCFKVTSSTDTFGRTKVIASFYVDEAFTAKTVFWPYLNQQATGFQFTVKYYNKDGSLNREIDHSLYLNSLSETYDWGDTNGIEVLVAEFY